MKEKNKTTMKKRKKERHRSQPLLEIYLIIILNYISEQLFGLCFLILSFFKETIMLLSRNKLVH